MHQETGKLITTHLTQTDIAATTATSTGVFPSPRLSCGFALSCGVTVWINLLCILSKVIPFSGSVFALSLCNMEKKMPRHYIYPHFSNMLKRKISNFQIWTVKNATISYTSLIYSRTLPCYTPDSYHYFHTCFLSILSSCLHPFDPFSFIFLVVLVLNLAFPFLCTLPALSSLYNLPKLSALYFPTCIYFLALSFPFSLHSQSFLLSFPS